MKQNDLAHVGDSVSGLVVIGAFAEWLPPLAALFAIVWTMIRMYEWFRFRVLGHIGDKFE